MKLLVLNSGSSSIKFQLFEMLDKTSIVSGIIEQIGDEQSKASMQYTQDGQEKDIVKNDFIKDHKDGLNIMKSMLIDSKVLKNMDELSGIGHRVVHGGEDFSKPTLIDHDVITAIESLVPLAPLHNPANLDGIRVMIQECPNVPQVAIFDTAFHASLPKHAYMYALPYEVYEEDGVRKYGFHGTSHHYVVKKAAEHLQKPLDSFNAITLHLGNGASMAAVENGKCIDTSMGLTPLEGLVMGTRSGDIDPAIIFYLARKRGLDMASLDKLLNKESGLKGICGNSDMREVQILAQKGDAKANLALDIFAYRIKKYIGSYMAVLSKVDALIFTGGIGENDIETRLRCCSGLENLGITIDKQKNSVRAKKIENISDDKSDIQILIVPTNEELEIALQTANLIESKVR